MRKIASKHFDPPGSRLHKPQHLAKQDRFAGPGAPDNPENLALFDLKIEIIMHHLLAELCA